MKTDARVRYTKKIIRDVFLSLLMEKPVEKITVTEICEKAEINRATFYKHYKDVYDLKEQLENEVYEDYMNQLTKIKDNHSLQETLTSILTALRENLVMYVALCGADANTGLANRMISACYEMFAERSSAPLSKPSKDTDYMQKLYYAYISAGSSGVVRYWAQNGMQVEPAVIANAITQMLHQSISRIPETTK